MDSLKSKRGYKGRHLKIKKQVFEMLSPHCERDNVTIHLEPNVEKELSQSMYVKDIKEVPSYHKEEVDARKSTYSREVEDEHTYCDGSEVDKVNFHHIKELKLQKSNCHDEVEVDKGIDHTGEGVVEESRYGKRSKIEHIYTGDHVQMEAAHNRTGDVEIEQTHQVPTSEVVVDLTQDFDRIFQQKCFQSFSEFEILFNRFKEETGSVFRVKSSCSVAYENCRRKKHVIPERYKFVSIKYCCVHYGQPKISGIGIRSKQRYLPCGCSCILSLAYSRGGLFISQVSMLHNHQVSSQMAPYYAINRHITKSELQDIADVVEMMPSSRALQQYLTEHFQRPITLQDAKNVRTRLKSLQSVSAVSKAVKSIYNSPVIKTENPEIVTCIIEENYEDEPEEIDTLEIQENTVQEDNDMEEFNEVESPEMDSSTAATQCKSQVLEETKIRFNDIVNNCSEELFWERMAFMSKVLDCWENNDSCSLSFDRNFPKDNSTNISVLKNDIGDNQFTCPQTNNSEIQIQNTKFYKSNSVNSHMLKSCTRVSKFNKKKRGPGRPRKYSIAQNENKVKQVAHYQQKQFLENVLEKSGNQDGKIEHICTRMEVDTEIEETDIEIELGESGNIHNIKRINQDSLHFEELYVTDDILCDKSYSNKIR